MLFRAWVLEGDAGDSCVCYRRYRIEVGEMILFLLYYFGSDWVSLRYPEDVFFPVLFSLKSNLGWNIKMNVNDKTN
jgi:hypothetical protein